MGVRVVCVLVVDADNMLRQALLDYLDTCDDLKAVSGAKNAAEAIALCAKLKPDVLLVDIQLPDMDGIEAIRQMHAHCPHAPVVVLTKSQLFKRMNEGLEAGATAWLEKGIAIGQIMQALRTAAMTGIQYQSPD